MGRSKKLFSKQARARAHRLSTSLITEFPGHLGRGDGEKCPRVQRVVFLKIGTQRGIIGTAHDACRSRPAGRVKKQGRSRLDAHVANCEKDCAGRLAVPDNVKWFATLIVLLDHGNEGYGHATSAISGR